MWDLIVSVSDHFLSFYFDQHSLDKLSKYLDMVKQTSSTTLETELKVTQSALDVHMACTPFVKD